jgi:hypothetical protein
MSDQPTTLARQIEVLIATYEIKAKVYEKERSYGKAVVCNCVTSDLRRALERAA